VGGSSAAAQLLQLLMRPEIQRALFSMLLGSGGASSVPVGTTQVPVSAMANTVGQLAQQATAEYEANFGEATSASYLDAIPGNYDATNPVSRAEAVQQAFAQADAIRVQVDRRVRRALGGPRRAPAESEQLEAEAFTERDYQDALVLIDSLQELEA